MSISILSYLFNYSAERCKISASSASFRSAMRSSARAAPTASLEESSGGAAATAGSELGCSQYASASPATKPATTSSKVFSMAVPAAGC